MNIEQIFSFMESTQPLVIGVDYTTVRSLITEPETRDFFGFESDAGCVSSGSPLKIMEVWGKFYILNQGALNNPLYDMLKLFMRGY